MTPPRVRPGHSYPLGATWDGAGVNFALFSENATGVDPCLFDEQSKETHIPIREHTDHVWHIYLSEARPGIRRPTAEVILDSIDPRGPKGGGR